MMFFQWRQVKLLQPTSEMEPESKLVVFNIVLNAG